MFADLAFFSFVELLDQTQHRAYNEWHQLDHRPENLALPGVAWGDRWALADDYREHTVVGDEQYAGVDYTAMYWFRPPIKESVRAWDELGEASFQWGRGPLIPGVTRRLLAFFRPVKGYVSPHALVDADVLPFRPNRGLHLTLSRFTEPHGNATHEQLTWYDRVRLPDLMQVDGVAGAWTFSFSHHQRHSTLPFESTGEDGPGSLRIRLLYLDQDPLEVTTRLREHEAVLDAAGRGAPQPGAEQILLSTPVRTIIPWQDW